jgi:predicted DNA-binding transcriptional regulator AlpA
MDPEAEQNRTDSDLLLMEEVAARARMSVSTLRWLRHRGEGPAGFRLGRRVVFRRAAVEGWIAQHEKARP